MNMECPFYLSVPQTTELYNHSFLSVSRSGRMHSFTFSDQGEMIWTTPEQQTNTFPVHVIKAENTLFLIFIKENQKHIQAIALSPNDRRANVIIFYRGNDPMLILKSSSSLFMEEDTQNSFDIYLQGVRKQIHFQITDGHIKNTKSDQESKLPEICKIEYCIQPQNHMLLLSYSAEGTSFFAAVPNVSAGQEWMAHGIWNNIPFSTPGYYKNTVKLTPPPEVNSSSIPIRAETQPSSPQRQPLTLSLETKGQDMPKINLWKRLLLSISKWIKRKNR